MMKYFDATTSLAPGVIRANIIRDMVYLKAEEMLVGKNVVEMRGLDAIDIKFDIPTDTKIDPDQVSEGALADLKRAKFYQISTTMDKYQSRVLTTDETKARQLENYQTMMTLDQVANGLAYARDSEIFAALVAGSGNTQAASGHWHEAAADPATDIANAIGKIFETTTVMDTDIANLTVLYPAPLWGHLARPVQIGEIQMTLRNWAEREYKISMLPTRMLTNTALCVIKSPQTAIHLEYTGSDIPTSEQVRYEGVGDGYLVTQYYKTIIIPYAENQTTTKRICTLTGIA